MGTSSWAVSRVRSEMNGLRATPVSVPAFSLRSSTGCWPYPGSNQGTVRAQIPAARASQRPVWAAGVSGSRQPAPGRLRALDTQRPQVASRARPSNSRIPAAPSMNQVVYQAGLLGRMTAGNTNSPSAGTRASSG
jgi:hypothetical protein